MIMIVQVLALMEHPLRIMVWMAQVRPSLKVVYIEHLESLKIILCVVEHQALCYRNFIYYLYFKKTQGPTTVEQHLKLVFDYKHNCSFVSVVLLSNCGMGGLKNVPFLSAAFGISSDFMYCCRRFEQIDGLTCQMTSAVWSSYIVGVFGMISKSQSEPVNRPVDPNGVSIFYLLGFFGSSCEKYEVKFHLRCEYSASSQMLGEQDVSLF